MIKLCIYFLLLILINSILFFNINIDNQLWIWIIFFNALLVLSIIDFYSYILPDLIVIPFLVAGLLLSASNNLINITFEDSLAGSIIGFLILWSINFIYRSFRKIDGLGFGDMKMFAMVGAWLGVQSLASIMLISSLIGISVVIPKVLTRTISHHTHIPFGPSIALASFITFLRNF